ncbi:MAG: hypothetical protein LH614_06890 [Pyrinomonadaceae bacterium]|nr:hypothetical protein [Pyrinomonadaceae bacterium]
MKLPEIQAHQSSAPKPHIKDTSEANLVFQGLCIIAEYLAESGWEMTFRSAKFESRKITFEPSEEALLRLNRLDDSEPLRQVDYKSPSSTYWEEFCTYFRFVLSKLTIEDEYDTITEKIIHGVFDFALLNTLNNDPMNSRLRPLACGYYVWSSPKCYSKFEAFTSKYAAQIKEVELKYAARIREVEIKIESFPRSRSTELLNSELLLWIDSTDTWKHTDLRISSLGRGFNLEDKTVDALLNSPKFHVIRSLSLSEIYLSRPSLEKILTIPNLVYLDISGGSYADWAGPEYVSPSLSVEDLEFLEMHQRTNKKLEIRLSNQGRDLGTIIGAY